MDFIDNITIYMNRLVVVISVLILGMMGGVCEQGSFCHSILRSL